MTSVPFPVRRQPYARRVFFPALLTVCLLAGAPATGQQLPEGLVAGVIPLPATTSLALATSAGMVLFDGMAVTLVPQGQAPQVLLQLPAFTFGSFLLQTGPNHVLFGHAGPQHGIWHLPLQGPVPTQPLAMLAYNYDAAMFDASRVLVSARTGGFGVPDNELWLLELATGNTQLVASVPGASGPVAIAPNGDVCYATGFAGFPVPAGASRIWRFPRSRLDVAIANHRVVDTGHARLLASGLDAASDLAFDDDGDLLFVDWFNNRIGEISDAASSHPMVIPSVIDYGALSVFATTLQFVAGAGGGVFEPFQPANGSLLVHETDYVSLSRVRTVQARAATAGATVPNPIPTGSFVMAAAGGPSLGFGVLAFAFVSTTGTTVVPIAGFEAPLLWSNALFGAPVLVPAAFDAAGNASWTFQNPGFAPLVAATSQVALVSLGGALGATAPVGLQLSQ